MNIRDLSGRLGLDEDDFMILLELLVSTAKSDIEKLADSVQNNEMEEAANLAHSLKGSAGNLGFMDFAAVAESIEKKSKQADREDLMQHLQDLHSEFDHIKTLLKGS